MSKGSQLLIGINYNLSGDTEVVVCQKNGVVRVQPLSKRKRNTISKKS